MFTLTQSLLNLGDFVANLALSRLHTFLGGTFFWRGAQKHFNGPGWCQQFGIQVLPKGADANFCHLEKAVFRCFFGLNRFSRSNSRLSSVACHPFLESLCISGQFRQSGNNFSASYNSSEFCWQIAVNPPQHLRPCHIEELCREMS